MKGTALEDPNAKKRMEADPDLAGELHRIADSEMWDDVLDLYDFMNTPIADPPWVDPGAGPGDYPTDTGVAAATAAGAGSRMRINLGVLRRRESVLQDISASSRRRHL